jgi:3-dehydroquinate synthase
MTGERKNIALVGFMGTGKTTIGKLLAQKLRRPFVDTDILVEQSLGMTIPEVFARLGERAFRDTEARLIHRACGLNGAVISVGGGAIERAEVRAALAGHCFVVLLTASLATIMARVGHCSGRPLLDNYDEEQKAVRVAELLYARAHAYHEVCHLCVDTDRDTHLVVEEIVSELAGGTLAHATAAGEAASTGECKAPSHSDTPAARSFKVSTARGLYRVYVGSGILRSYPRLIAESLGQRRIFIVSNPLVSQLWLNDIKGCLEGCGHQVDVALVGDGEKYKDLGTASHLFDLLISQGHDRDTVVVALGGGVVGDLAGFVASTFMRGIDYVQIPTTLLAQVDASIGGKVAVDHREAKNLIGAFHQPKLVLSDVDTLRTLPPGVFADGMAEAIKTGILGGESLFCHMECDADRIKARDPERLQELVLDCGQVKSEIVSEDERDTGRRLLLNLGHTFGHAIEAASDYDGISHGEAVAVGMCMATRLSSRMGLCGPELLTRTSELMRRFDLPTSPEHLGKRTSPERIKQHLRLDKKRHDGRLRFVLPRALGDVALVDDVPEDLVDETIRWKT